MKGLNILWMEHRKNELISEKLKSGRNFVIRRQRKGGVGEDHFRGKDRWQNRKR